MSKLLRSAETLALDLARSRLANLWFLGSGVLFLVLVVQSIFNKYPDRLQEVWSWFVPTVVPSLALMLGVIGAGALSAVSDERRVRRSFFNLAWGLSVFYLVVLALTVLLEPFAPLSAIELFTLSNYWLSPVQGLVVAAIGVLFAAQEGAQAQPTPAAGD